MKVVVDPSKSLILSSVLLFLFLGTSAQNGDNERKTPSDEELESYVEIDLALREIRKERQKKVMNTIKESELGMKGYRKVSTKQDDESAQVSEEKQKAYEKTKQEVKEIQKKYRDRIRKKIEEMGMEPSRFREIGQMKKNKEVRRKMIRIKEKKMEKAQEESGN